MLRILLKSGKEEPLLRFHPWVFSGAIARVEGKPTDGDLAEVFSSRGEYLATGHFHDGSIAIKVLTFQQEVIDASFWLKRLSAALALRRQAGIEGAAHTNAFRLVHGEGDRLPGLVIDLYGSVAVIQAHSIGIHRAIAEIAEALQKLLGQGLSAIYDKSMETLPAQYAEGKANGYIQGSIELPQVVLENSLRFAVNWETGQKTGFFLDQRDNRALLERYAKGRRVLNAFCYSGGFSVYALRGGALSVDSVDASAKAIDLAEQNVRLNFGIAEQHRAFADDIFSFLNYTDQTYDLMILDPPAFSKSISTRHRAVLGYKRLNMEGLQNLAPGGILFTFSCSQSIDRDLFYNTIVAAALAAKRQVQVLHFLSQAPDHPTHLYHPESHYLKGLVLAVE